MTTCRRVICFPPVIANQSADWRDNPSPLDWRSYFVRRGEVTPPYAMYRKPFVGRHDHMPPPGERKSYVVGLASSMALLGSFISLIHQKRLIVVQRPEPSLQLYGAEGLPRPIQHPHVPRTQREAVQLLGRTV